MQNRASQRTVKLVETALLLAIEIILAFTPLGYLKVGIIEITFMTVPVAIGAMLVGPGAGTFLGLVFGVTSFIQCFGMSPFGAALLAIDPVRTFILCVIPRTLMGLLVGLIFRALRRVEKKRLLSFVGTSFSAAFLNTLFFVLGFALLFHAVTLDLGGTPIDVTQMNLIDILLFLAGVNGLVEVVVCTLLASALGKALVHFLPEKK